MLDLSFGTVLLLGLMSVGTIAVTEGLKKIKYWKTSVWNIPGACLVTAGAMTLYELIGSTGFEVKDVLVIALSSLLVGCAAGGLYKMVQGFGGK